MHQTGAAAGMTRTTSISEGVGVVRQLRPLAEEFRSIPSGRGGWREYEKLIEATFIAIFQENLSLREVQSGDAHRANVRDLVFENHRFDGFWGYLRNRYMADYVVVEAKNHQKAISGRNVAQLASYLVADGCGLFGILASRLQPSPSARERVVNEWRNNQKMIITLSDEDLGSILLGEPGRLETIISARIWEIRGRLN